jgi:hypothetical protein
MQDHDLHHDDDDDDDDDAELHGIVPLDVHVRDENVGPHFDDVFHRLQVHRAGLVPERGHDVERAVRAFDRGSSAAPVRRHDDDASDLHDDDGLELLRRVPLQVHPGSRLGEAIRWLLGRVPVPVSVNALHERVCGRNDRVCFVAAPASAELHGVLQVCLGRDALGADLLRLLERVHWSGVLV